MQNNLSVPKSAVVEFATVDMLLNSSATTAKTDAFIISNAKLEKQIRKMFYFLVYQFPIFSRKNTGDIINTISKKNFLYYNNFLSGFDALYPKSFANIIGVKDYCQFINTDKKRIQGFRNKIIHGQSTGKQLKISDLENEIIIIRNWCFIVAKKMYEEIGFDGFSRNSFRKLSDKDISSTYLCRISSTQDLDDFIEKKMHK